MKTSPIKIFSKAINSIKKCILSKKTPTVCQKATSNVVKDSVCQKVDPNTVISQLSPKKIPELLGLATVGSTTAYVSTKDKVKEVGRYTSTTA